MMRLTYSTLSSILTLYALTAFHSGAHADSNEPLIADIQLGMTAQQVRPILEKNAGNTPIKTYTALKADGSGTYISAYSVNITQNKPASGFESDGDHTAIVFAEFNGGGAITIMRRQNFSNDALPSLAVIEKSVEDHYNIKLHPDGKLSFIASDMRDQDGKPTQDRNCNLTAARNGGYGQFYEGMQVWANIPKACGVLLFINVYAGPNGAIANSMNQRLIDTQNYILDINQQQKIHSMTVERRKQEDISRSNQVAPKL